MMNAYFISTKTQPHVLKLNLLQTFQVDIHKSSYEILIVDITTGGAISAIS
jgi:hypothetical protein